MMIKRNPKSYKQKQEQQKSKIGSHRQEEAESWKEEEK